MSTVEPRSPRGESICFGSGWEGSSTPSKTTRQAASSQQESPNWKGKKKGDYTTPSIVTVLFTATAVRSSPVQSKRREPSELIHKSVTALTGRTFLFILLCSALTLDLKHKWFKFSRWFGGFCFVFQNTRNTLFFLFFFNLVANFGQSRRLISRRQIVWSQWHLDRSIVDMAGLIAVLSLLAFIVTPGEFWSIHLI